MQDNATAYRISAHTDGAVVDQFNHKNSTLNLRTFKGGSNTPVGKKSDIIFGAMKFGSAQQLGLTFNNISEESKALRLRQEDFQTEKIRKNFSVKGEAVKGDSYSPFSLFKTTVAEGYNKTLTSNLGVAADIANYHDDVTGPDYDIPMQGPFTSQRVGGFKSRKRRLTDVGARLERFRVDT